MTIGCATDVKMTGNPNAPWFIGSYVAVTFRDPNRNDDAAKLVRLAENLLQRTRGSDEYPFRLDMRIEPLKLFFGLEGRYELLVRPGAWGQTEEAARAAFDFAARALADAVRALPAS
jgi:hypothetical protein